MQKSFPTKTINNKTHKLHRLLMEEKIGRKLTFYDIVLFKDGNYKNAVIDNLYLVTRSEFLSKTKKLEKPIDKICEEYVEGEKLIKILRKYKISQIRLSEIIKERGLVRKRKSIQICVKCNIGKVMYHDKHLCTKCYKKEWYINKKQGATNE